MKFSSNRRKTSNEVKLNFLPKKKKNCQEKKIISDSIKLEEHIVVYWNWFDEVSSISAASNKKNIHFKLIHLMKSHKNGFIDINTFERKMFLISQAKVLYFFIAGFCFLIHLFRRFSKRMCVCVCVFISSCQIHQFNRDVIEAINI